MGLDLSCTFQICDSTGNLEDTGIGPGTEAKLFHGMLEQLMGRAVNLTKFSDMPRNHQGVAEDLLAFKSILLDCPGLFLYSCPENGQVVHPHGYRCDPAGDLISYPCNAESVEVCTCIPDGDQSKTRMGRDSLQLPA